MLCVSGSSCCNLCGHHRLLVKSAEYIVAGNKGSACGAGTMAGISAQQAYRALQVHRAQHAQRAQGLQGPHGLMRMQPGPHRIETINIIPLSHGC